MDSIRDSHGSVVITLPFTGIASEYCLPHEYAVADLEMVEVRDGQGISARVGEIGGERGIVLGIKSDFRYLNEGVKVIQRGKTGHEPVENEIEIRFVDFLSLLPSTEELKRDEKEHRQHAGPTIDADNLEEQSRRVMYLLQQKDQQIERLRQQQIQLIER